MKTTVIGLYVFDGPMSEDELRSDPGICAFVEEVHGKLELVDLLPSSNLKQTFETNQARLRNSHKIGRMWAAAYYMPGLSASERRRVADEIEQEFDMVEALAS